MSLDADGQNENNFSDFFKFSLMSSKNYYKLVMFCSPFNNYFDIFLLQFQDYLGYPKMCLVLISTNQHCDSTT